MNQLLVEYALIINHYSFKPETGPGSKTVERYELTFKDRSRLVTYESRNGTKFKYSYQWITADNQTICRWDNIPPFPLFDTHPFHRHAGPDEVAEPFPAVSLIEVLTHIVSVLLLQ